MVLAGKLQDKMGPRVTAMIGGALVGLGFIWISQTNAYWAWVCGFGLLVGTGLAFGYAAATPPALKWFPPNRTGRIAGIVVSGYGFGLASVYIAPLATYLLAERGLPGTMLSLGIGFLWWSACWLRCWRTHRRDTRRRVSSTGGPAAIATASSAALSPTWR